MHQPYLLNIYWLLESNKSKDNLSEGSSNITSSLISINAAESRKCDCVQNTIESSTRKCDDESMYFKLSRLAPKFDTVNNLGNYEVKALDTIVVMVEL